MKKKQLAAAPSLILASGSPRRQELLRLCEEPFTVITADIDEDSILEEMKKNMQGFLFERIAAAIVQKLAATKAAAVLKTRPEEERSVILGADTIVVVDEEILGKPASKEEALAMLRLLSGREHSVYTGVSIQSKEAEETFFTCTKVRFYPWEGEEETLARRYVEDGSPLDKAGAYGIQDRGALLVESICGDYYTVMGLPVSEVHRRLRHFGLAAE